MASMLPLTAREKPVLARPADCFQEEFLRGQTPCHVGVSFFEGTRYPFWAGRFVLKAHQKRDYEGMPLF